MAELGNLRAAVRWAIARERDDLVAEFAAEVARELAEAGLWADFDLLTDAAHRALERLDRPEKVQRLLSYRAQMAQRRGADAEADRLLRQLLNHARARGDLRCAADTLFEIASHEAACGAADAALETLERAAQEADAAGFADLHVSIRAMEARLRWDGGDSAGAAAAADASAAALGGCQDRDIRLFGLVTLGVLHRDRGDGAQAERLLREALMLARDGERTFAASRTLLELGALYEAWEYWPQAARAYRAADRIHAGLEGARRREQASRALARFRRRHGARPEVQAAFAAERAAPWYETAARLLAAAPVSRGAASLSPAREPLYVEKEKGTLET